MRCLVLSSQGTSLVPLVVLAAMSYLAPSVVLSLSVAHVSSSRAISLMASGRSSGSPSITTECLSPLSRSRVNRIVGPLVCTSRGFQGLRLAWLCASRRIGAGALGHTGQNIPMLSPRLHQYHLPALSPSVGPLWASCPNISCHLALGIEAMLNLPRSL
jgi:hypothetical protein